MNIKGRILIAVTGVFIATPSNAETSCVEEFMMGAGASSCAEYISDIGDLQTVEELTRSVEYTAWMRSWLGALNDLQIVEGADSAESPAKPVDLGDFAGQVSWILCYCEQYPSSLYAEATTWLWGHLRSEQQLGPGMGGHPSEEQLARVLPCSDDISADVAAVPKEIKALAEQGDAIAQFKLGYAYHHGEGVPQDDVEAVKWFRKSAEQGVAEAQFNLGSYYDQGVGVPQDYAEAVRWYRKAAEQGVVHAQRLLGDLYANGWGVPQDDTEAAIWYRKAAEQGDALGQHFLGVAYDRGWGVPQHDVEAVKWYRMAAEQGEPMAQTLLGIMYSSGRGLPQDYQEAAKWYREAAEQGIADAQRILGFMYAGGQGLPQDFVAAHMWIILAAARDDEMAREALDQSAAQMTPAQIAQAEMMAREWDEAHSAE